MNKYFKTIFISLSLFTLPGISLAAGTVAIGEVTFNLDTIRHIATAPGVTLTQLHLSGSQPLDVFYSTIDISTPGLKLRNVTGSSANGLEKTSSMAKRLNDGYNIAVAGINGDFFDVITTYPDGSERPRKLTYTSIIDGNIHKTSSGGFQFIVDNNGNAHIDNLSISKGFVSDGSTIIPLGGINIESINYSTESAPDNAITVYTGLGWKSTFQTKFEGKCAEVCAKLISTDKIETGKNHNLQITTAANSSGNTVIPAGGVVLHGQGIGKQFLESLSVGDIITLNTQMTLSDGTSLIPLVATGGNPRTVSGGKALESDGSRPDAVELHPRTGAGISKDGKKVIFMVVDGRGASVGVTTRQLGDLLVYAGAEEGLNFDGGGSSTCWSAPFGVVNKVSGGSERTVGNGLFATVVHSMENDILDHPGFADWKIVAPRDIAFKPVVYGYSPDGLLIDTDLEDYTLSSSGNWARITDDGKSFTPVSTSGGVLTVSSNGKSASVIVEVLDTQFLPVVADHEGWKVTGTSVKIGTTSSENSTFTIPYTTGPNVTQANVKLVNQQELTGEPIGIIIGYSSNIPVKSLSATIVPNGTTSGITFTDNNIKSTTGEWVIDFRKNGIDINDPAIYPLKFRNIDFVPGEGARTEGFFKINRLQTYQVSDGSGVEDIYDDGVMTKNDPEEWFSLTGMRVSPALLSPGIYIRRQGKKVSKIIIR